MRLRIFFPLIAVLMQFEVFAQGDPIYLTNPSFEDMPRHSKPPRGWYDCGFDGESPPDVQPSGTFSVTKPPQEGNTYLGMVVRDNDTWEAVSQQLSRPLEKGKCYEFSIYLSRSELYVSTSRITDETANYTTPAKLRIFGGFGYCDKKYMLAETSLIINTRWLEYRFKFEPVENYTFLILEAFYKTPTLFPYNGNILIDNASPITMIPCEEPVAKTKQPETPPVTAERNTEPAKTQTTKGSTPTQVKPQPEAPRTTPKETPQETEDAPVSFSKIRRSDLREGQSIRVDRLFFEVDKSVITNNSFETLNDIYQFLTANEDVVIEVGGHSNGLCTDDYCDKLSTERARAVAVYLAQRGIPWDRLKYKGYGKRKPISSNDTAEGRRRNQRVEIKILSMDEE